MKRYNIYFIFLMLIVFSSCQEDEECDLVNLEEVRENDLNLNQRAERSLNNLTHTMMASVTKHNYSGENMANYRVNEFYFKLNENTKKFWFVTNSFRDQSQSELMYRNEYSIDLKDLTPENIYYDNNSLSSQSIGIVNIHSKNNNPKGVRMNAIDYTSGERKLSFCEYRSSISLNMAPNRAIEFVNEINSFLRENSGY
ncbi:hypothetical protein ACW6QP_11970 [Salegentibacter sp. HM20]